MKVYVAGAGKDAGKGLLVDVGAIKGAERWTRDRREAMHLTQAQARKVIDVLRRAGITAAASS
jgi:transposase